jgi:glutamine synthetase
LYVIPVYKTAFLNPFDTTSLDFICRFVTGDGELAEQVEIEFLPDPVEDAADVVVLGKWLCQSVANRHGLIATFSPKIQIGDAGSGLHFHAMLKKNNRNIMLNADQEAPTTVCWGYSNRSALIRVPLGWRNLDNLAMMVNPQQKLKSEIKDSRQTAE